MIRRKGYCMNKYCSECPLTMGIQSSLKFLQFLTSEAKMVIWQCCKWLTDLTFSFPGFFVSHDSKQSKEKPCQICPFLFFFLFISPLVKNKCGNNTEIGSPAASAYQAGPASTSTSPSRAQCREPQAHSACSGCTHTEQHTRCVGIVADMTRPLLLLG